MPTGILLEFIGFCAGIICTASSLPAIYRVLRHPHEAAAMSQWRNAMLCSGNLIWVVYAALIGSLAIGTMCAIAATLNAMLIVLARRARPAI